MESLIYLDTHIVVWLYLARLDSLSQRAHRRIEGSELLISPMVALELEYLHEIGRLTVGAHQVVHSLGAQIGLRICDVAFPAIIDRSLAETWTRDPFDRIIAAQASITNRPLITRDENMREHCPVAFW